MKSDADALGALRGYIGSGRPVAIQYMTSHEEGTMEAHWVVVTDISGGEDPLLTVQSQGNYCQVQWSDIKDPWRRGWVDWWKSGSYPHVVGKEASEILLNTRR